MKITVQKVVEITYTLKNDAGEVLDESGAGEPLRYIHGKGQIVPGLEKALLGKSKGMTVEVSVAPAEGYGVRDDSNVFNIPVRKLHTKKVTPGMRLQLETADGGVQILTVLSVKGDYASVDGNHPLAGQTLHFSVAVTDVRDATAEELAHGHAHGPGGHH